MSFLGKVLYEQSAESQNLHDTGGPTLNSSCEMGSTMSSSAGPAGWPPPQLLGKPRSSCSWWMGRHDGKRGSVAGAEAMCEHIFIKEESACMPLAWKKNSLKEFSSDKCHKNAYAGICKGCNICSQQCFDHVVRLLK